VFRAVEAVIVVVIVATIVAIIVVVIVATIVPIIVLIVIAAIANPATAPALIAANRARAQDGEGSVGVSASLLDDDVSIRVERATLIDRVVVAALSNLTPDSIDRPAIVAIVAAIGCATATKNDVANRAVRARQLTVAVVVVAHGTGAQDREIPVHIPAGALDDDVAVGVVGAPLVDRISVAILANYLPRSVDGSRTACARRHTGAQDLGVKWSRRRGTCDS
jgi:hypothetical protein